MNRRPPETRSQRLCRRFRALRAWLTTPADAWLLVRMLAWSPWLPLLKRLLPLPTLVRFLSVTRRRGQRQREREQRVVALARWLYRSPGWNGRGRCLERSLLLYHFLS